MGRKRSVIPDSPDCEQESKRKKIQTSDTETAMPSADAQFPAANLAMAVHTVLHTTELLEQILLELSCKQLVGVQRVSQHFMSTIAGSIKLQAQMFLLTPTGPAPLWKRSYRKGHELTTVPYDTKPANKFDRSLFTPVQLNPLLVSTPNTTRFGPNARGEEPIIARLMHSSQETVELAAEYDFSLQEVTNDFFLTSPPCKHVECEMDLGFGLHKYARSDEKLVIKNDAGVKLSDLRSSYVAVYGSRAVVRTSDAARKLRGAPA